ncbi:hypothetical protein SAMN05421784_1622 [Xenorhabdus koppenhoeferi]|uniref:Uncharacterized protein n=2 Tax=Xenorhabdus koppenhoeferi TaxID=351659 RepID=A0A1I7KGX6_9GAMM|nr:hypothetical protein [Xenorhabdus koppenhoeferi]SFU96646.1 hypothetical protein SAMN05421784_1622 [Xenorhabdus koppenhoeferi]
MKINALKIVLIFLTINITNFAYAGTDKPKISNLEETLRGNNCQQNSPFEGYVVSVASGYATYTQDYVKNFISISFVDKDRKNIQWYYTQYDADTDAGKSMLALALYAAVSGQKAYAQCVISTSSNYPNITSLWVGPDAW